MAMLALQAYVNVCIVSMCKIKHGELNYQIQNISLYKIFVRRAIIMSEQCIPVYKVCLYRHELFSRGRMWGKIFQHSPTNLPLNPKFQSTYPTGEYDWVRSFLTSFSVQNHYLFRLSSSCPRNCTARRNDPEMGGKVSTSKAWRETVAAVSNTITPYKHLLSNE